MYYPILSRGARLMSAKLQNESGQEIGEVVEWLMDVHKGCVIFVVAEFYNSPGFYPIPWPLITAVSEGAFAVDQPRVQRPELFLNHYELSEMIEDWDLLENIFMIHGIPLPGSVRPPVPRTEPEKGKSFRHLPSGEWMWVESGRPTEEIKSEKAVGS